MSTLDLEDFARDIHELNKAKGFYSAEGAKTPIQMAGKAMLIVCEVAEMVEELRKPAVEEGKVGFPAEVEEWADVMIRALDYAEARGFTADGIQCMIAKTAYNRTRPARHGKLF